MPFGAILLAGGSGKRFKSARPKQLLSFGGEPLFLKSLRALTSHPSVTETRLVVPKGKISFYRRVLSKARLKKDVQLVEGGPFRGASVRNGFRALSTSLSGVLVHDAARPLISKALISRVIEAARQHGCALPVWPVAETLKKEGKNFFAQKTIPRSGLWLAQTPQGFSMRVAKKTLPFPKASATDDVSLAEAKKIKVKMVMGERFNVKVTNREDFQLCSLYLKEFKRG